MDQKDLISVIIPIHNGEKHIKRAFTGLQKQTYQNLEIIVVLNNCTDHSPELCSKFADADPRIHVFTDPTQGLALVRGGGTLASSGKYILWMDIDDYYADTHAIEKMHEAIVADQAQVVQFSHFVEYYGLVRKRVDVTDHPVVLTREQLFDGPLMGVAPGRGGTFDGALWSKIYDGDLLRAAMQECQVPVFYQEDCFMNFLAFTNDRLERVSSRNEAYYVYRRYGGSMTDSPETSKRILQDYNLFKPIELKKLQTLPVNPQIELRVNSESLWSYRSSINQLIRQKCSNDDLISLIADSEQMEFVRLAKAYFRTHPDAIWTEEMNFMISDYTPEEYLDWCREHLPPLTRRQKIRSFVKKLI